MRTDIFILRCICLKIDFLCHVLCKNAYSKRFTLIFCHGFSNLIVVTLMNKYAHLPLIINGIEAVQPYGRPFTQVHNFPHSALQIQQTMNRQAFGWFSTKAFRVFSRNINRKRVFFIITVFSIMVWQADFYFFHVTPQKIYILMDSLYRRIEGSQFWDVIISLREHMQTTHVEQHRQRHTIRIIFLFLSYFLIKVNSLLTFKLKRALIFRNHINAAYDSI